jgi:hypothetical protein
MKELVLSKLDKKEKDKIVRSIDIEKEKENFNINMKAIERYSLRNKILILMQCKNPTELKGFKTWRKDKRSVVKGKGICICKPNKYLDKKTNEYKLGGFKYITIWDIANTNPIGE